ncbi:mitochondrial carrier [Tothia fuscella]|uniref:Mitochondrial carrier n=1 Tax=Tothia fuscella TaxID=1048955 RepID=A0A9P4TVM7_9PEZI|nr:mitochondrial carrier [Tothia fuscella]
MQQTSTSKAAQRSKEAVQEICFGSLAGVLGKLLEYPFDTVKVRLQSQPDNIPLKYKGPLDCFRQSFHEEGMRGLYRGISAPLVGAAVETSSLFFSYRVAQDFLRATILPVNEPLPISALFLCGAASGAFTSLLLTPIELVKCKMQVPVINGEGVKQIPRVSSILSSVYRHQGIAGLWHGQMGTLIRETGGSAAWFGSKEMVTKFFRKYGNLRKEDSLPVYQQMTAGAAAGMSYNFIFYPADTIKSRMQTEDVQKTIGGRSNSSFMLVGKDIWKQHGLSGLYRGCGITVLRAAPSSAVIFTTYDALIKRLEASIERIVLDPRYHDPLMLVKAVRNGIVYGTKVRFPHALVMVLLFRNGTFRQKVKMILKATRQHARNLALFALVYKGSMLGLNKLNGKENKFDAVIAGGLGGYFVFGPNMHTSVNQQIIIYIAARVALACAKLLVQPSDEGRGGMGIVTRPETRAMLQRNGWAALATVSWGSVMYLFRYHPEVIQPSLRSSMTYIYANADNWDSLRNFIWHNK